MNPTMRAKMVVNNVLTFKTDEGVTVSETLTLAAVSRPAGYPPDGSDEDNTYAKWSPSASLTINIANPALHGRFSVGQKFYVDFTEAVA